MRRVLATTCLAFAALAAAPAQSGADGFAIAPIGFPASDEGFDRLLLAHAGGVSTLTPRSDGSVLASTPAPVAQVEPVAMRADVGPNRPFVVDRGADAVVVLDALSLREVGRVPVGSRPSAIAIADVDVDFEDDLVVANEGSDDVSIALGLPGGRRR